jgi:hypothetical protein
MAYSKKTFAYIISSGYLHKALASIRSIQQFNLDVDFNIAYFSNELPSEQVRKLFGNRVHWHLMREPNNYIEIYAYRPTFLLALMNLFNYKQVNHIGADVIAYSKGIDLDLWYKDRDAAFICHNQLPVHPIALHKTGLLNSDLTYWSNNVDVKHFLKWQAEQLELVNSDKDGYFFDQVYLDFALTSLTEYKVLNSDAYGKAYYNLHEGFNRAHLVAFHFSGFVEDIPTVLTRFKFNRLEHLTADVVKLAIEYGEMLYDAKEEIEQANEA